MKKNIGITLSLAAAIGVSVIAQSNVDFAQLSEQSATKVIESLGNIKSNQFVGNIITDYSNYKKEKEASSKEDYKDYKDDALYIADLKIDKAVVERIEKDMEKEKQEEEASSSESTSVHTIGEIPGPRNDEKEETLISQNTSEIPSSSHISLPETVGEIPSTPAEKETPVEVVNITASNTSDEKETSTPASSSISGSEHEVSAKPKKDSINTEKSDSKTMIPKKENESLKLNENSAKKTDTFEDREEQKSEQYVVVHDVYFREDKSNESKILGTLKKNLIVEGKSDSYWIEMKQGDQKGYVSAKYLEKTDETLEKEAAYSTAQALKEDSADVEKTDENSSTKLAAKVDHSHNDKTVLDTSESQNSKEMAESTNTIEDKKTEKYVVVRDVYFREDKSNDSKILGTLKKDFIVEGKSDPYWIEITQGNQKAFVSAKFLKKADGSQTKESEDISQLKGVETGSKEKESTDSSLKETNDLENKNSKMQNLIEEAKDLAAEDEHFSKEKIKNSNFIQYLYKTHLNIELSSDKTALSKNGYEVNIDNLKAGDLVFSFDKEKNIDKAGLYIGGNRFIYPSESGVEFINSDIKSDDYNKTFVTARRIMN